VTSIGPGVLVAETTLPHIDLALTLTSTYLAAPGAPTRAAHALARAGELPRSWSRTVEAVSFPLVAARSGCLLDHLAELADAFEDAAITIELAPPSSTTGMKPS
jgi:hypothetical protein